MIIVSQDDTSDTRGGPWISYVLVAVAAVTVTVLVATVEVTVRLVDAVIVVVEAVSGNLVEQNA